MIATQEEPPDDLIITVWFGDEFDAAADISDVADWLKGRTHQGREKPKVILFRFRASDTDAGSIIQFMRICSETREIAETLSQCRIQMDFGNMTDESAVATYERIVAKEF